MDAPIKGSGSPKGICRDSLKINDTLVKQVRVHKYPVRKIPEYKKYVEGDAPKK